MINVPNYPIINGHAFQFSSIEIFVGFRTFRGFKEIKYTQKREIGKLYGNSVKKLARTRGRVDTEGSLTMYQHEWEDLRDALGPGWLEATFPIIVLYSEYGPIKARCDVLNGCTITSVKKGGSEGTEALIVDLDLDIMDINESSLSSTRQ
jgi:hypothetical protein